MRQASRQLAVRWRASCSLADSSGGLLLSCVSKEIRLHEQRTHQRFLVHAEWQAAILQSKFRVPVARIEIASDLERRPNPMI